MSTQLTQSPPAALHMLLVEDRGPVRDIWRQLFAKEGFIPIVASSLSQAISELHATPQLAVVVTDVDLGSGAAHGGVELLLHIRSVNPDIPVVAYSAHYEQEVQFGTQNVLKQSSKPPQFTRIYPKVSTVEAFKVIVSECTSLASEYLLKRREDAAKQRSRIESDYPEAKIDVSFLRNFFPDGVQPADGLSEQSTVEQILSHEGFRLKQVRAGFEVPSDDGIVGCSTSTPIPVWVRQEGPKLYMTELYGYPSIYAEGETQDLAIEALLILMLGYHLDFKRQPATGDEPGLQLLEAYLGVVFRGES